MNINLIEKNTFVPFRSMYSKGLVKDPGSSISEALRLYANRRDLESICQKKREISLISPLMQAPLVHSIFKGEFLKRIPKEQKEGITRVMAESPSLEDWEVQSLQKRNWGDPGSIFQKKGDWLYRAMKAYSEKKIDEKILAHLFLYDSCKDCLGFTIYSGTHARNLLLNIWHQRFSPSLQMDSNEVDRSKRFDPLASFSEEECQIFSFQVGPNPATVFRVIAKGIESHSQRLYPFVNMKGPEYLDVLMIPPNLFQQFLNLKFGSQAIECSPVIGYRDIEKLSDPTKRVVSICGRSIAPCHKVHSYDGTKYPASMLFHDYYHCLIESSNPHRPIYAKIAMLPGITQKLKNLFLDRELVDYLRLSNGDDLPLVKNLDDCFWGYIFPWIEGDDIQVVLPYIRNHLESWGQEYGSSLSTKNFEANSRWFWGSEESRTSSKNDLSI